MIIAADGRPYEFFRKEMPLVSLVRFPGIRIDYPEGSGMVLKMTTQMPGFILSIRNEHILLRKLVRDAGATLVISENRYGCWHPAVKSVFITHQLDIQVPGYLGWGSALSGSIVNAFIRKYDECWIPDYTQDGGLAGRLSHPHVLPGNCHYIGTLSRFYNEGNYTGHLPCPAPDIFVLLSGPEPQRSLLESLVLKQLRESPYSAVIAGGRPESGEPWVTEGRITIFPHLDTALTKFYLQHAGHIICRSGYSTLMDLACLGRTAILVPTPGQTEQEYLASSLKAKKIHYSVAQNDFRLKEAMELSSGYTGVVLRNDQDKLSERIRKLSGR